MKLGTGLGHIVLEGTQLPLFQRGTAHFRLLSVVAKRRDLSRCHLVGGRPRPGDSVLDEDILPQIGTAPQFSAHVCCG